MDAANPRDHALVVGISHYVGLPDENGKPSNLLGPVADAKGIFSWLVDPSGGGLDQKNVELVHSDQFPPFTDIASAAPTYQAVKSAFLKLVRRTEGVKGRRLYVYMSGHGFAPDVDRGALLTAECQVPDFPNINVSGWFNWFRASQRYDQFVLWMDCCFDSIDSIPVEAPSMMTARLAGPAGPRFIALAAQTGMRALECPIKQDQGKVHGVFTWTLLSGLRGGAADPSTGEITGDSLRAYLLSAMRGFIPPERLVAREVSAAPHVMSDPGLLFGTPKAPPKFNILLRVRDADGTRVMVLSGSPPREVSSAIVSGGSASIALSPGLYVAQTANGNRAGFDVTTKAKIVELNELSPPFNQAVANNRFMLAVRAVNASDGADALAMGAQITLQDWRFLPISTSFGVLGGAQPCGVYKAIIQYGSEVANRTEHAFLLDKDTELKLVVPTLSSAVPLMDAAPTHEYQVGAAASLVVPPPPPAPPPTRQARRGLVRIAKPSSAIGVLARYWTGESVQVLAPDAYPNPFDGLSIMGEDGKIVADLSKVKYVARPDPVASFAINADPGAYVLRQVLANGVTLDRSLIASKKWQTNAFIWRNAREVAVTSGAGPRVRSMGSVSLLMAELGSEPRDPSEAAATDRMIEGWRLALRDRSKISPDQVQNLLFEKFVNPIAGIIGAHLYILSELTLETNKPQPDRTWLEEVIINLRALVGSDHPDIEALSLLCPDSKLRAHFISAPPQYFRSWEIIDSCLADPQARLERPAWWENRRPIFDRLYTVWIGARSGVRGIELEAEFGPSQGPH